jgi:hypothetical protein
MCVCVCVCVCVCACDGTFRIQVLWASKNEEWDPSTYVTGLKLAIVLTTLLSMIFLVRQRKSLNTSSAVSPFSFAIIVCSTHAHTYTHSTEADMAELHSRAYSPSLK